MGFGSSKPAVEVIESEEQLAFFQFYNGVVNYHPVFSDWHNKGGDFRTFYLNIEERVNDTYVEENKIFLCSFVTVIVGDTLYIKNFIYNMKIKTGVSKLAVGALNTFLLKNTEYKNIVYCEYKQCKSLTGQIFTDLDFYLVKNTEILLEIKSQIEDPNKYIFWKKR